jgi:hypothetical protein
MAGRRGHAVSCAIGIAYTARCSPGAFGRWVGSADHAKVAMAKWLLREADRLDPTGILDHIVVFGERNLRHLLRAYADYLQSHPNTPVIGQGLPRFARHRANWPHMSCAHSGRIAPPMRQDLVFDRDGHSAPRAHRKTAYARWTPPSLRADLICDRDN